MDAAVQDAFAEYELMCELWAQARRHAEGVVLEAMQAESRVEEAELRLRFAITGETP